MGHQKITKLTKETYLKIVTYSVILLFLYLYITQENPEFIFYNIAALLFFWIVLYLYKTYDIPFIVVVGFCIWLCLHMIGGLDIPQRVYGIMLIQIVGAPYYILRYDQFVHFYCYLIIGALMYYVLKSVVKKDTAVVVTVATIAALGIGALNEVFEFSMTLILASTGVGDVYNTGLDLIFNLFGAFTGVFLSHSLTKK